MVDFTCDVDGQFYAGITFDKHICKFEVFEDTVRDSKTLTPVISGSVKWDGCSNVKYHQIMHYCEPHQFRNQNEILRQCYNTCAEYFNQNRDPEWQDKLPMWSTEKSN